ncbi:MAG: DUF2238 domain-containing protein [Candidatus Woesearchaeota archaeon]
MKEKTVVSVIALFMVCYLVLFSIIAVVQRNYEFLYYTGIMVIFIVIILVYYQQLHLPVSLIACLTILGVMHILGGNLYINSTKLYDTWLIPRFLKYDNLVHAFGTAIATLVAYNILQPKTENGTHYRPFAFVLMLILIAMGIGALNEIVEFFAVVFLGAGRAVGDYFNNQLDLVYNLIGSIIVSFFLYHHQKKHHAYRNASGNKP